MRTSDSVVRSRASCLGSSDEDRREYGRAPLDGPVLVEAFNAWRRTRCENVSVGGVSIECDDATLLPVGKVVEVYFELPSRVAVEAEATVVRVSDRRVALRFVTLSPDAEVALRAHCRLTTMRAE